MTPQDKEEFIKDFVTAIQEHISRDPLHEEEHQWIQASIAKEKQRAEFYSRVSQIITGGVVLGTLGWLGLHAIDFVTYILSNPNKH